MREPGERERERKKQRKCRAYGREKVREKGGYVLGAKEGKGR